MTDPSPTMLPVMIGECTGWFHRPAAEAMDVAVLLCQGSGQDYTNGYRPMRILADQLAAGGIPVLRFDYPGTGDAADLRSGDTWPVWRESVSEAADWLRRVSGAGRLVLAGLRIGAALAALEASARGDVAGLVLFEPVLTLRSLLTQMTMESRLRKKSPEVGAPEGGIALGELSFSARDLAEMRAIDITRLSFQTAMPAAIFAQADGAKLATRLAVWTEAGIACEFHNFAPFEALLRPSQHSGEAEIDATALLDWLRREILPAPAGSCALPWPGALKSPQWEEKFISFGEAPYRAGVLCQPHGGAELALLIGNSGGNPRHGFARFGTHLARRLGEAGIASLRFDFAGLGDSIFLEDGVDTQSDVFRQDREADFSAAIDRLRLEGFSRFAVQGLCSGAYHAVRAAAADPRIEALSVVNLPGFTLRMDPPGPQSIARKTLCGFLRQGTRAQFLFSAADTGARQFERHFGPLGQDLDGQPGIEAEFSESFDHELTEHWMQTIAITKIIRFLRHPSAQPMSGLVRNAFQRSTK